MNQTPSAFVLIAIALAPLATGIGSVWLAALLMRLGLGGRNGSVGPQHLLSLAAGVLLATAFMPLLPEAFEGQAEAHDLFATLLVGLVFFFLPANAELWNHGLEHCHAVRGTGEHGHAGSDAHGNAGRDTGGPDPNEHAHRRDGPRTGGWAVLAGDGVHCFGDGILIASAFMADIRLGVLAAVSVLVHEVPHHMGDLVVLCQTNPSQRIALLKVSLAGAVTVLGGVAGYFLVGQLQDFLPYFLVLASSSFVYVALADLIPQLQKRLTTRATLIQIVWLLVGMALVTLVRTLADRH